MSLQIGQEFETISFVGGDFQQLEFFIKDTESDDPVDLSTFEEVRWILFRYGDPNNPILNLNGEVVASNTSIFNVYLESDLTKNLGGGLYVHQPALIDSKGKEFRPGQGHINIMPRGNGENSEYIQQNSSKDA